MINLMGELGDILDKLFPTRRVDWFDANLTLGRRARATLAREHCSAFIALGEYNEELYVGHNMWWSFYALMPVLKTYTWEALPEAGGGGGGARRVQMSSLPGALSSIDDIYSLPAREQRLAVLETTHRLYDHRLYDQMSPRSLWCWARVMAPTAGDRRRRMGRPLLATTRAPCAAQPALPPSHLCRSPP